MKPEDGSATPYALAGKRVWVAGHRGMVGAALVRRLGREQCEILTVERSIVDLTRQDQVVPWMSEARPQAVFMAAAKVGGRFTSSSEGRFCTPVLTSTSSCSGDGATTPHKQEK